MKLRSSVPSNLLSGTRWFAFSGRWQPKQEVAQLVSEIGNAAEQQSLGIGQINIAVSQLDQVTQQNAALVQESASAADSLNQQARRLTELVGAFRLDALR